MEEAKILIIEDEAIVAEDLEMAITDIGYEVVGRADSADDAIKKAFELKPDLVLMDIVLKGEKNGIDASHEIKEKMDIPVIFLTAYSDNDLIDRAKSSEPYAYLVKPFQGKQLLAAIEMALYRSRMEKRLKESEEWLATTLMGIGDAVIATDREGYVKFMNPVAEGLTGYLQEDAIGKSLKDVFVIIDEDAGEPVPDVVTAVLSGGTAVAMTNHTILIARDGVNVPISENGAPIRDSSGEITGVVLVFRDVTENREFAARTMRLNEELEERVKRRTLELDHAYEHLNIAMKQMYHAQKMESIGVLAGGIAHDFESLLTVVLGNLSVAKEVVDEDRELFRMLAEMEKASLHAKDLTRQLLTFSGGETIVKETVDLAKLLQESTTLAGTGANTTCEFEMPDDLWHVDADPAQIADAVGRIITNADQAMPNGGTIRVTCDNVTIGIAQVMPLEVGDYVKISIEDMGVGIPDENNCWIFDPFFTTKPDEHGFGLATAYAIVKGHGGHIAVKSDVGIRTVFCIYLPASRGGRDAPPEEATS